ncbi:bifunctional 5,10-methylenetetrahydrofolate dehydrogenase/5,10-methenyltetrahydrofolate cyclohydrolase [Patescibacteria group bacterium]|nr:bifunctional 5,10-methylenetetrahydrofolate dehydrogenase/5,10-methenyltetrahydrofolate cyclohydrolase [Patescibacteria group bacterium]
MPKAITKILNGEGIADDIFAELSEKIEKFRVKPSIAVIMVGLDLESEGFQHFSDKVRETGIDMQAFGLEDDVSQDEVVALIDKLNGNKKIHGILVQLPLPDEMDQNLILDMVDPNKDLEGFHPENLGWISLGEPRIVPSTAQAVLRLLESTKISLEGKEICILGDNEFISRPLGQMFLSKEASVTILDEIKDVITKKADIIITALDDPNVLKKEMIKTHAVIIDITGDVDFEDVKEKASYITPWPKGVESLMTASLLMNAWKVMLKNEGYEEEDVE